MNQVNLSGRLTRDPEFRTTPGGKSVAQFTLAVDRPFKNADGNREADFISCVLWGKTAELVRQYLKKGNAAIVSGRIQVRSYETPEKTRRYVTEVIGDRVEFIGGRNADSAPARAQQSYEDQVPFEEEIPF